MIHLFWQLPFSYLVIGVGSSTPTSTIKIIHLFNIRDSTVFEWEQCSPSYLLQGCMQTIQHTLWSRYHRFQSKQAKTRENIFHFFLAPPGIEPFSCESSDLPSESSHLSRLTLSNWSRYVLPQGIDTLQDVVYCKVLTAWSFSCLCLSYNDLAHFKL